MHMKAKGLTRETISQLGVVERKFPAFEVGDAIEVSQWITEGNKKRIQIFEGDVIAIHNNGASSTFMVRRIASNNVAVERIFPYYTPLIEKIEVIKKGIVRRAKLFYIRKRVGKDARVKERIIKRVKVHATAEKEAVQG